MVFLSNLLVDMDKEKREINADSSIEEDTKTKADIEEEKMQGI